MEIEVAQKIVGSTTGTSHYRQPEQDASAKFLTERKKCKAFILHRSAFNTNTNYPLMEVSTLRGSLHSYPDPNHAWGAQASLAHGPLSTPPGKQ